MTRLREVCDTYGVVEVAYDPAWFSVQAQMLEDECRPMVEFPQTVSRVDGLLTHSGQPELTRHLANCVIKSDNRGERITKESPGSRPTYRPRRCVRDGAAPRTALPRGEQVQ